MAGTENNTNRDFPTHVLGSAAWNNGYYPSRRTGVADDDILQSTHIAVLILAHLPQGQGVQEVVVQVDVVLALLNNNVQLIGLLHVLVYLPVRWR